jgi:hypothetical protein
MSVSRRSANLLFASSVLVLSVAVVSGQNPPCYLCGGDQDATFLLPDRLLEGSDPEITCGELFRLAVEGVFVEDECAEASVSYLLQQFCGCSNLSAASAAPTEVPAAPVAPIEVPVAPVEVPVAPTEVPVAPIEVPIAPIEVPVAPTEVPVAPIEIPVAPVGGYAGRVFNCSTHVIKSVHFLGRKDSFPIQPSCAILPVFYE